MNYKITDKFSLNVDNHIEKMRAETFWAKEPETIEWINTFKPQATFIDIGANIGIYSCYAATLYPKMNIHAIEPMNLNNARIIKNKRLNNISNITIWPIAIGAQTKTGALYIPDNEVGATGAQIDFPVDEQGTYFKPDAILDVQQMTLDDFCAIQKIKPDYIKIDVDGKEYDIVMGMVKLLSDKILTSILVEFNKHESETKRFEITMNMFSEAGYTDDYYINKQSNHSRYRRSNNNPENIIFVRK